MNLKNNNKGFTLVELLIVIVIIAILAAISIVAYNGITDRAHNSAAKDAASQVKNKAEIYKQLAGKYPSNLAAFDTLEDGDEAKLGTELAGKDAGSGDIDATKKVYKYECTSSVATIDFYNSKESGKVETMTLGAC